MFRYTFESPNIIKIAFKSLTGRESAIKKTLLNVALLKHHHTCIHTYHSRFIPEGVTEASQIFLRDTHVLLQIVSYEKHCSRDRWPIAALLQSILGVSAIKHHHQPINAPTAGAQAFLIALHMEQMAITHHGGPVRVGWLTTAN
jgi:hypothetical protein